MAAQELFYPEPPIQQGRRFAPIPAVGAIPWSVAPVVVLALASWQVGYDIPQRPVNVAPLTLAYGQQPPKYSTANTNSIISTWPSGLEFDPQQRPLRIAPLTLTYGNAPPIKSSVVFWSGEPEPFPQQYRTPFPIPPAVTQVPFTRQYDAGWSVSEQQIPQRPVSVAPLTLVYGQQPPGYSSARLSLAVSTWPSGLDYDAQQRPLRVAPLTLVYGSQSPVKSNAVFWLDETPPLPQQRQTTFPILPVPQVLFSFVRQYAVQPALDWCIPQRLVAFPILTPANVPAVLPVNQGVTLQSWVAVDSVFWRVQLRISSAVIPPAIPPRIAAFIYGKPNAITVLYGVPNATTLLYGKPNAITLLYGVG